MTETADRFARPKLKSTVEVIAPEAAGDLWVICSGPEQYFRVGADLARLITLADGTRTTDRLLEDLGDKWSPTQLSSALEVIDGRDLLETDGDSEPAKKPRRLRYRPPLTLQLTLIDPDRILTALAPLVRLVWRPAGAALGILIAVGGLAGLVSGRETLWVAGAEPIPFIAALVVVASSQLATVVHEFCHGAVLKHFGARSQRIGVMLFYLIPAMFCDITDAWRLSNRWHRVYAALAGPVSQVLMGGIAGTVSLFVSNTTVLLVLLIFSFGMYVGAVINLIPLIKLDGYIALMSYLDIPNMRDRAMADARSSLSKLLLGASPGDRSIRENWSVPYGLACMFFPFVVVWFGFRLWSSAFLALAPIGSAILLGLIAIGGFLVCRRVIAFIRHGLASGGSAARAGVLVATLLAFAGLFLGFVQVEGTLHSRFVEVDDEFWLLVEGERHVEALNENRDVALDRRGILIQHEVGSAMVVGSTLTAIEVPWTALYTEPTDEDDLRIPTVGLAIEIVEDPEITVGQARVDLGRRRLGLHLYETYVEPSLDW